MINKGCFITCYSKAVLEIFAMHNHSSAVVFFFGIFFYFIAVNDCKLDHEMKASL
jgi:hypothetical protein